MLESNAGPRSLGWWGPHLAYSINFPELQVGIDWGEKPCEEQIKEKVVLHSI